MATPSSSGTTPSPLMASRHPNGAVSPTKISTSSKDLLESEERERAIQKFLASAELSKLTRGLRTRLGYASYKAAHNLSSSTLRDLEAQTSSQSSSHPRPTFAPPIGNVSGSPANKKGSMGPPPAVTASAGQSLFASLLGPPPTKRARTIRNPQDPHVPAPVRPASSASPGAKNLPSKSSINTSVAERTRSHAKGSSKKDARKKPKAPKKGKAKEDLNDVDDMKAAATLTSLLMHSRPGAMSTSSPRSSISERSDAGSSYSHFAPGSSRAAGDRNNPSKTPSPPIRHATVNTSKRGTVGNPKPAASDSEAAELMMFLATSPSPARPNVNRDRDTEAYRMLGGGPSGLKGRVLFSGASEGGRPLTRDGTGSFASTVTAVGEGPLSQENSLASLRLSPSSTIRESAQGQPAKIDNVMEVEVTPPTPVISQPLRLLPPPISPPTSPNPSTHSRSGVPTGRSFEFLSTDSRTPHTPGNVAFNLNEFINVSPSPGSPRVRSTMPPPRVDVGRRLFGDEQPTKGILGPDGTRPANPARGSYLGAGIDFVRT